MPETVVSHAWAQIRSLLETHGLNEDSHSDTLEEIFGLLAQACNKTRLETIEDCATRLEALGNARMEYVGKEPKSAPEIEALPGLLMTVYGEATGARWLAKILRGGSDKGWLPSWRWGESRDR